MIPLTCLMSCVHVARTAAIKQGPRLDVGNEINILTGRFWPVGPSDHRQLPGIGTQRQQFGCELAGINACSVPIGDRGVTGKGPWPEALKN
jgi:hypothetical protein